jgi:RNA polymerase sporulation-specific sigma factor
MEEKKTILSDEELVSHAQTGDKQATEELLLRYSTLVRALSRGYFLVGGETEDLIQEGMIGLYHAINDYKGGEGKSFKNFAYMCVERKLVDALKKFTSKKNKMLNESVSVEQAHLWAYAGPSPEDDLILSDERREFKRRMSAVLSDFEFKIMWMYMEGLTRSEICESTGKAQKSVDNAIERSKRKLQALLKK